MMSVMLMRQYKSASAQSNPSISTGRKVLNILQNHYVEREFCFPAHCNDAESAGMGRGLVVNMP